MSILSLALPNKTALAALFASLMVFVGMNTASALTVGPAKIEYAVDPGDVVSGELVLINEESEPRTFYPVFEKFTEVNGERKFWPGEDVTLAGWFDNLPPQTIQPGKQVRIPYTIRVPWNAPPGGHFAVTWWSNSPPTTGQRPVSIVTRAGILFYVRVSGDIVEEGAVTNFKPGEGGSFYEYIPENYLITFNNEGNVHLKPQGSVEVRNIFGQLSKELAVNAAGVNVLPKGEKNLVITNPDESLPFAIGPYTVRAILEFGDSNLTAESQAITIFVFPWKTVLIFLLIVVGGGYVLTTGIKRYNRWIINRYSKQG